VEIAQSLNWEIVALIYCMLVEVSLFFMSLWYSGALYGATLDPEWHVEVKLEGIISLMEAMTAQAAIGAFLPIRTCLMWMRSMVSPLTYVILTATVSPNTPEVVQSTAPFFFFLCYVAFYGSHQHEAHARASWLAKREAKNQQGLIQEKESVLQAMQLLAGTLCDIVISLDDQSRVIRSEGAQTLFLGKIWII